MEGEGGAEGWRVGVFGFMRSGEGWDMVGEEDRGGVRGCGGCIVKEKRRRARKKRPRISLTGPVSLSTGIESFVKSERRW